MAVSQTNLKTEAPVAVIIDERTPWQKAEYERRRVSYRKEFKDLCLQHIQFLKRKESIIDFERLFNVWQLYIKYKKLEAFALLKHLAKPVQQNNNTDLDLLDQQIVDVQHDIAEIKNKNAFIYESLANFSAECPEQPELAGKDFVDVVQTDAPEVQIDGAIISDLLEKIKRNLLNEAHKCELNIALIQGNMQELELTELAEVLAAKKEQFFLHNPEAAKFVEIPLALDKSHFNNGMLQISLLMEQEKTEVNVFEYRTFKLQEITFKRSFRRDQMQSLDTEAEIERKLIDIRARKEERQKKARADFRTSRLEIEHNINNGKTADEIAALKAQHTAKYTIDTDAIIMAVPDTVLPVPPTPAESKFNLEKVRNDVIIATAQIICESLARLALATSARDKLKTPQEHTGLLYLNDPATAEALSKQGESEDQAIMELDKTSRTFCALGKEINQLIKGLE